MADKRPIRAEIFEDTINRCRTSPRLHDAVETSTMAQEVILERQRLSRYVHTKPFPATVVVSEKRCLEAAHPYAKQGKKVCVLNFASATNPGGGVAKGSSTQEESICRCTTLYPCISGDVAWEKFYLPHREAKDPLYNDDCIYTPEVCVLKSDIALPRLLPEHDWWHVNVISCAAPNLRTVPSNYMNPDAGDVAADISEKDLEKLLTSRIRRIFEIAAVKGNDVLILGAFGCGAFQNPPELVAKVFHNVAKDFSYCFDAVEFAVYHTERDTANFEAFQKEFNDNG